MRWEAEEFTGGGGEGLVICDSRFVTRETKKEGFLRPEGLSYRLGMTVVPNLD